MDNFAFALCTSRHGKVVMIKNVGFMDMNNFSFFFYLLHFIYKLHNHPSLPMLHILLNNNVAYTFKQLSNVAYAFKQ